MKYFYCLLLLLCTHVSKAQSKLYPVNIGEKLPLLSITRVVNHPVGSINLASYSGKLLLLDFMYTTCGSCIRILPFFDSLRQQFSGRLEIIAVTPQSLATLSQFLKKSAIGSKLKLPFIAEDNTLHQLFPHEFVSHVVWISPDGLVKAITGADYVNEANIRKVLNGDRISWPVKKDEPDFDFSLPLTETSSRLVEMKKQPLSSSSVFPYLPGVRPFISVRTDSATQLTRRLYINISLPQMLKTLYGKWDISNSRLIISTADSARYIFDPETMYRREWNEQNLFCYESFRAMESNLTTPIDVIRRDIEARFNMATRFVTLPINCLILRKVEQVPMTEKQEQSASLWHALQALNNRYNRTPVIDSVGGIEKIYLSLSKSSLANDKMVLDAIRKAGYALHPQTMPIEMLLITDAITNNN